MRPGNNPEGRPGRPEGRAGLSAESWNATAHSSGSRLLVLSFRWIRVDSGTPYATPHVNLNSSRPRGELACSVAYGVPESLRSGRCWRPAWVWSPEAPAG